MGSKASGDARFEELSDDELPGAAAYGEDAGLKEDVFAGTVIERPATIGLVEGAEILAMEERFKAATVVVFSNSELVGAAAY
jgi:hypothetical protein